MIGRLNGGTTMQVIKHPSGLTITTPQIHVNIDDFTDKTTPIIISHLTPAVITYLQHPVTLPVFISQDLYELLQILTVTGLLKLSLERVQIMPTDYPTVIGNLYITPFPNDDDLWGSVALLIEDDATAIGYCATFTPHGNRKKRLKKWKRHFRDAHIKQFYFLAGTVCAHQEAPGIFEPDRILNLLATDSHQTVSPAYGRVLQFLFRQVDHQLPVQTAAHPTIQLATTVPASPVTTAPTAAELHDIITVLQASPVPLGTPDERASLAKQLNLPEG